MDRAWKDRLLSLTMGMALLRYAATSCCTQFPAAALCISALFSPEPTEGGQEGVGFGEREPGDSGSLFPRMTGGIGFWNNWGLPSR